MFTRKRPLPSGVKHLIEHVVQFVGFVCRRPGVSQYINMIAGNAMASQEHARKRVIYICVYMYTYMYIHLL